MPSAAAPQSMLMPGDLSAVVQSISIPDLKDNVVAYVVAAILFLMTYYAAQRNANKIDLPELKTNYNIDTDAQEIMQAAYIQFKDRMCKTQADVGEVIIFPRSMINNIKSLPDFPLDVDYEQHTHLPGFEGLASDKNLASMINKRLTRVLAKLTTDLSDEATLGLKDILTDSPDWHEVNLGDTLLAFVGRLSGRIFMGPKLCRSKEWLAISTRYAGLAFATAGKLRAYHPLLRYIVHWFMPECQDMRRTIREGEAYLKPYLDERKNLQKEAAARGEAPPKFDDAIEWTEQEYVEERSSHAVQQLNLSTVAIHTTTDLTAQTLMRIALNPEYFELLRKEIVDVLGSRGLSKQSLTDLKLMDAVIKETQRLKPVILTAMQRKPSRDITLPNGFKIKKGQMCWVTVSHHFDPEVYPDPQKFDPYRWLSLRGTNLEHQASLVSTSDKHLGFGHGTHSCPGRFFAAHEVKLTLCHLLMKYDWRVPTGMEKEPLFFSISVSLVHNPALKLEFRRREEELNMDTIKTA